MPRSIARFDDFKTLADKKKDLFDSDIEALVLKAEVGQTGPWQLENLHVVSDSTRFATGRVVLRHTDGRIVTQETSRRRSGGCRDQGDRTGDRCRS